MNNFIKILFLILSYDVCQNIAAQGIEISPGGKIECIGSTTLEINDGNFINNGTYTMGNETFTLSGTSNGLVSGSSNNDIYNLNANNSNGITLNGSGYFAINNLLQFSNGLINTGSNIITINNNATTSGCGTSKYINGNCRKVGNEAFVFPIGNNGKYAPIGISAPSLSTDHFTASYKNENPNSLYSVTSLGTGLSNVSTLEYWTLNRTNGSSEVSVTLNWNASSTVSDLTDLRTAIWDGTKWNDDGNSGTTGNSDLGNVTSNLASNFGVFTLGSSTSKNPLPVELTAFKAFCENDKIKIQWSTASETNCDYFIVEKMQNGGIFSPIAHVSGNGNSNKQISYQVEVETTNNEVAYFRLTQIDYSGEAQVFNNRIIYNSCDLKTEDIHVFNNSALNTIIINSTNENKAELNIFDINGRLLQIKNLQLTSGENAVNTRELGLSAGIYLVKIYCANKIYNLLIPTK